MKTKTGKKPTLESQVFRAQERIDKKFAGQYVAYVDGCKKHKTGLRFIRKVLANGYSLKDVNEALEKIPSRLKAKVFVHYAPCFDPDTVEIGSGR